MNTPAHPLLKYMTVAPYAIGKAQSLAIAESVMKKHDIRHLPVLDGGVLIGMLSDRDIQKVCTLRDVQPERVPVEEAMSTSVYAVSPDAPLEEVVSEMAEHKYGSVVAMHHGKVAGIFTTVDACRVLGTLLRARAR